MGPVKFVVFYLLGGLAATAAADPRRARARQVPNIGASGAIAGGARRLPRAVPARPRGDGRSSSCSSSRSSSCRRWSSSASGSSSRRCSATSASPARAAAAAASRTSPTSAASRSGCSRSSCSPTSASASDGRRLLRCTLRMRTSSPASLASRAARVLARTCCAVAARGGVFFGIFGALARSAEARDALPRSRADGGAGGGVPPARGAGAAARPRLADARATTRRRARPAAATRSPCAARGGGRASPLRCAGDPRDPSAALQAPAALRRCCSTSTPAGCCGAASRRACCRSPR